MEIDTLPFTALCLWTFIILWGAHPLWLIITGRVHRHAWVPASLALFGIGVVFLALHRITHSEWLNLPAWVSLIMSAVGLMVTRALNAPDGHKRAVMLCHMGIVVVVALAAYFGGQG